jgi:hypothetical protein
MLRINIKVTFEKMVDMIVLKSISGNLEGGVIQLCFVTVAFKMILYRKWDRMGTVQHPAQG